ncbi:MAG TPA: glycoside hydrolase family 65 protein, partial [Dehalococcoidia bacterium]|nr:glycoside hydrolase family 65 protein [Dehalococcoidia bacterium]
MNRESQADGGTPDAQRLGFGAVADFAAARAGLADETWALLEEDYEPALERELESRFAVANGFIGMRGSLDVPSEASLPRTYVAGLYAHRPGPPPLSALVPAPNAFPIRLTVDGVRLDISQGEVRQHARLLHYREGSLRSLWRQRLPDGREVGLESVRFAAMNTRQVAAQLLRLRFDRASEVEFALEEGADSGSLTPLADTPQVWVAGGGHRFVACLRVLQVAIDGRPASDWIDAAGLPVSFACQRELSLVLLTAYGLGEEPERVRTAAASALSEARGSTFPALLSRHGGLWESRWQASEIVVEGDEEAQKALRFAVFHLNGAARPGDAAVSIAARGLTGDGYLGHVFWDTEAFILPFFTFTWPEVARSLLEYRVRTLPAARAKAQRLGFRGAFYAWESTDTGEESTPPYALGPHGEVIAIRNGDLEKHVSAAIPYAVWRYWLATHDEDFLLRGGAEVMLETARFWASCARLEPDGQFHIRHVIGPDEYHEDVDDNAYTNYMARWTIERAIDTARLLSERHPPEWRDLAAKTGLTDQELADWERVASALYL